MGQLCQKQATFVLHHLEQLLMWAVYHGAHLFFLKRIKRETHKLYMATSERHSLVSTKVET